MKSKSNKTKREKKVPEFKIKLVQDIANNINSHKTLLIASTRNLPSSHFHEIKKNLRGKAEIKVARKSAIMRALDATNKQGIQKLKESITSDVALFFSNLDPFELSALLGDSQSPSKAKAGDIAPEDIKIEPGPTDLVPGPAISELSGVGLKVSVEGGKLAIKLPATVVKQGEAINEKLAGVLAKLNVFPMKVGFEPVAAYESSSDKVYVGIKIDKKKILEDLRVSIGKALSLAVSIKYLCKETLSPFLARASAEENAIISFINKSSPALNDTIAKEGI
jgi:large subunit ribosomal protein L10